MNKFFIVLTTIFLSYVNVCNASYGWGFSKNNNHTQPYIGKYVDEIMTKTDVFAKSCKGKPHACRGGV